MLIMHARMIVHHNESDGENEDDDQSKDDDGRVRMETVSMARMMMMG